MINKIEHIGIAVKNLEASITQYEALLQTPCYKIETVDEEFVKTAFFKQGDTKIELLQALDSRSAIARYIEKRGEGIHHIAYEVRDIKKEMSRLAEAGYRLLEGYPKIGADRKLVCFIHPKDTNGVLTELVQAIDD